MTTFRRADLLASLPDAIRQSGVALDPDIREDAFPVSMAGELIEALASAGVVVLGGDFYERDDSGRFRALGRNWYYEGDDVSASVEQARTAIAKARVASDWYVTFVWRG